MPFDSQSFEVTEADVVDPVLRNLITARDLLSDRRKWARGEYCVGDAVCALGALLLANGEDPTRNGGFCGNIKGEIGALRAVLSPVWLGFVHSFNDAPSTTHADVLALFDRAIASRRGMK